MNNVEASAILLIADKIYSAENFSSLTQEQFFILFLDKIIKRYTNKNLDIIKATLVSYFDY